MTLFTRNQFDTLIRNGHNDSTDRDPLPVVKLHMEGTGCIWQLTAIDPDEPLMAYGLADLHMQCPEICWISLDELRNVKLPLGVTLMADDGFLPLYSLSVNALAAKACGYITEDQDILNRYLLPQSPPTLRPV